MVRSFGLDAASAPISDLVKGVGFTINYKVPSTHTIGVVTVQFLTTLTTE